MVDEKYRGVAEGILEELPEIKLLSTQDLQDKVVSVWASLLIESEYEKIGECGKLKGYDLAKHTRHVTKTCIALADLMEEFYGKSCDRDVLIASGLLHDASSVLEKGKNGKTELGNSLMHSQLAGVRCWEFGLPGAVAWNVSHHSFSPPHVCINPKNLEFVLLTYADLSAIDEGFYMEGKPTHLQITKRFYSIN